MKKCIIVCAGEFIPIKIEREEGDFVIAVDGGYAYCKQIQLFPDLIIGDFDSISDKYKTEIMALKEIKKDKVVILPCEKDDTDTVAAIKIGLEKKFEVFQLYGATGGRIDHMMANIQCLHYIKNHHAKGYIITNEMMMLVLQNEKIEFHPKLKGLLSIFSLDKQAKGVTIKNMKYELENETVNSDFPIGISNEFTEKAGTISVEEGTLLVMIYWK